MYVVGRNADAAARLIDECKASNPDGKINFLKADLTELREVDRVCAEIRSREKVLNVLVQTQGNMSLKGRDGRSSSCQRCDTC